jgi:hypothetical protein
MTLNLTIRKFDIKSCPDNATMLFLGRRRSGKTSALMDFLYHKRRIPCGVVVSGTEESNHSFRGIVPDIFIYGEYRKEILEKVIARQRKLVNSMDDPNAPKVDPRCFIILDDVMYDKGIWKQEIIRQIMFNGRHYNILFMSTCQYLMDLPPMVRTNLDFTFVMREPLLSNKQKIHQYFCGIVPDFKAFCGILDATTTNYECLVVDNVSKSSEISEVLFWYKAKLREPGTWRVGSDSFWKHHQKRYKDPRKEEQEQEQANSSGVVIKKTGPKKPK